MVFPCFDSGVSWGHMVIKYDGCFAGLHASDTRRTLTALASAVNAIASVSMSAWSALAAGHMTSRQFHMTIRDEVCPGWGVHVYFTWVS